MCDLAYHGGLRSREKAECQAARQEIIQVCEEDINLVAAAKDLLEANQ